MENSSRMKWMIWVPEKFVIFPMNDPTAIQRRHRPASTSHILADTAVGIIIPHVYGTTRIMDVE